MVFSSTYESLRAGCSRVTPAQAAFSYLAALSIASAVMAVTRRSPVHSLLWVLALFVHVAGIFLLVGAEFLAAVQMIVYAGAILVFYLLVFMLLDLPVEEAGERFGPHWPLGALTALGFAAFMGRALMSAPVPARPAAAAGAGPSSMAVLGKTLFTDFALPFEIASLVLLAAIVGAVVLARRRA